VTDRVLLQRERDRLAAIVKGSFDAIVGADYGYTNREALGKPLSITIPSDAPDNVPVAIRKIKRGERVSFYMTERMRKDGRRLTVCLAISPIRDIQGKVIGASTVTRDLTEKLEGAPVDVGTASVVVARWLAPPAM
jgi:PAS domain S-box-containing protein